MQPNGKVIAFTPQGLKEPSVLLPLIVALHEHVVASQSFSACHFSGEVTLDRYRSHAEGGHEMSGCA